MDDDGAGEEIGNLEKLQGFSMLKKCELDASISALLVVTIATRWRTTATIGSTQSTQFEELQILSLLSSSSCV